MPNALTLAIQYHPIFWGSEVSIRHDPGYGIATIMPHAALPPDLRQAVPEGRRRSRTDQVSVGALFYPDNRALSWIGAGSSNGGERQSGDLTVRSFQEESLSTVLFLQ